MKEDVLETHRNRRFNFTQATIKAHVKQLQKSEKLPKSLVCSKGVRKSK